MRNIPEHVDPNDPRAPWNDNHPEPDKICPHCRAGMRFDGYEEDGVRLDDLRTVIHHICPNCGEVMKAMLRDMTEPFLESWRSHPEEMADTIDSYSELREIGQ